MKNKETIHIEDDFVEIGSRTIDQRNRLVLSMLKGSPEVKRAKIYMNSRGEVLIKPLIEIPASEAWLYKDKDALRSVKKGLDQATKGRTKEVDVDSLD